jgi:hypothetical protein
MPSIQTLATLAVVMMLLITVGATGIGAFRLLAQPRNNPLPASLVQTIWSVVIGLWVTFVILCWLLGPR